MRIIVDADACPVKDIIFSVAGENSIPVILVCSVSHVMPENAVSEIRWVDNMSQAVDIEIINLCGANDIIVTGDIGLASLVMGKGCKVISFRGDIFKEDKMDHMLESRYLSQQVRKAGGKTKGPNPFTDKDSQKFEKTLRKVIESNKK